MNDCNLYDWGSMLATWDGYCMDSMPEEISSMGEMPEMEETYSMEEMPEMEEMSSMGEMPEMDYDDWTFTVSMVMNAGCETMMYPEEYATIPWADVPEGYTPSTNYYHVEEVLTRPIGECTTNVIGSSVIFVCMGDYIAEHVYIDAADQDAVLPETPTCDGELQYTMVIENG